MGQSIHIVSLQRILSALAETVSANCMVSNQINDSREKRVVLLNYGHLRMSAPVGPVRFASACVSDIV